MSVEETPAEEDPLHRPLPSVNMPLLRHQRRDARMRQLALIAAALAVGTAGVVAFVVLDIESAGATEESAAVEDPTAAGPPEAGEDAAGAGEPDAAVETVEAQPPAPLPDPESEQPTALGAVTRTVNRFGNARGFRDAMIAAGASAEEYDELENALEDVMDFRRCRPEDLLVFERDTGGHLVLFEYRGSSIEYYQATRARSGELRGEKVQVPIQTRRVAAGGRVQTSLGAAFESAGLGRALVGRFIEAFEGKVNFNTQARQGDTFRIIAEEERINGEFHGWGTVHAVEYVGERAGELRAFWFAAPGDDEDDGEFYEEDGRAVRGGWLRTPLQYDRISSRFDPRRMHPILRRIHPHNGVDYAAGTGAPVWATADGTITFIGERGANGNLVALRHANGYESFYAHLSRFARGLSRGDTVEQRQIIGYVGSTGRSTGPHLHFGLKQNGRFVDPLAEINGPGRMMPRRNLPRFRSQMQRLSRELRAIEVGGGPTPRAAAGSGEAPAEDNPEEPMD